MDFFKVLDHRRSVRAFRPSKPEPSKIEAILDAANLAPSAGDLQAYRIVVAVDHRTKTALAEAAHDQRFIADAAAVLVFFADPARSGAKYHERGRALFAVQDATIAAAYAQLAATAIGLASCWVGAFDDDAVARAVNAPGTLRPVAILPVGDAAETPERPPRRPQEELVVDERFASTASMPNPTAA